MCNVAIAKFNLAKMKLRTEKDLYHLKYESIGYTPLTNDVFEFVKGVCIVNKIKCPLYKWGGHIKIKADMYYELSLLASIYSIVFNIKNC